MSLAASVRARAGSLRRLRRLPARPAASARPRPQPQPQSQPQPQPRPQQPWRRGEQQAAPRPQAQAARFPYNLLARFQSKRGRPPLLSGERFPLSVLRRPSYQQGKRPFYLKPLFFVPVSLLASYLYLHVDTVELTGRRRLLLLPAGLFAQLMEVLDDAMADEMAGVRHPEGSRYHRLVQSIVKQLCEANNLPDLSKKTIVIENPELNAFCTGGGLIVVNTGLIEAMHADRNKLALVLGHEMGHFIAQHSAEQAGQILLALFFKWILGTPGGLAENAYHLGIRLPASRRCEQEADYIGLNLAARACFSLKEAYWVWHVLILAEMGGDEKTTKPEDVAKFVERSEGLRGFLSTHPTWKWRIKAYDPNGEWMQNAMDLQRETCMPYNFGAPPRVNPLAWWLDQTRAFLPQVMKAKEVEAQQQPEAEAGR